MDHPHNMSVQVLPESPFGSADILDAFAPPSLASFGRELDADSVKLDDASAKTLTVGLIDGYRFSQECLIQAFERLRAGMSILAFPSVQAYVADSGGDLDLVIYHWHVSEISEAAAMQNIAALHDAFPQVPVIVFSDSDDTQQLKTIRSTLKSGAHGFVPTRTTGIPIAAAAIRFVKDGGTFAPLDVLLTHRPDRAAALPEPSRQNRLTSRQVAVLSHLQQGKANKIIAHELGMSESTVKVHVRNIMRKMGATNRTQAAYKAQKLWDSSEFTRMSEL